MSSRVERWLREQVARQRAVTREEAEEQARREESRRRILAAVRRHGVAWPGEY